jgi:hypothetical protein
MLPAAVLARTWRPSKQRAKILAHITSVNPKTISAGTHTAQNVEENVINNRVNFGSDKEAKI